jgi:hypothetical protein
LGQQLFLSLHHNVEMPNQKGNYDEYEMLFSPSAACGDAIMVFRRLFPKPRCSDGKPREFPQQVDDHAQQYD